MSFIHRLGRAAGLLLIAAVVFILFSLAGCGSPPDDAVRREMVATVVSLQGADGEYQVTLDIEGYTDTLTISEGSWNNLNPGQQVDVACLIAPGHYPEVCWLLNELSGQTR